MQVKYIYPLMALILACNGPKAPVDDTQDTDTGEPVSAPPLRVTLSKADPRGAEVPIVGAMVAIDDALGGRVELRSDAEGVVSAEVAWEHGPFSVSVDAEVDGFALVTQMGVTEQSPDVILPLAIPPDLVQLEGAVTGHEEGATLLVSGVGMGASYYQSWYTTDHYFLSVAAGAPFALIAVDFTYEDYDEAGLYQTFSGWTVLESEGVTEDTTLDLTLTGDVVPLTAAGTFALPEDPADPLQDFGRARAFVMCNVGMALSNVGWETHIYPQGDGTFAFEAEYVAPSLCEDVTFTVVAYRFESPAATAIRWIQGTPDTWDEVPTLLPTPILSSIDPPSEAEERWTLHFEPLSLSPGATRAAVFNTTRGDMSWLILGITGDDVTLPPPPSTKSVSGFYGSLREVQPWITEVTQGRYSAVTQGELVGVR